METPAMCPWDRLGLLPSNYDFCEANVCGWVVEPANTWSCVAYVAWGLYIIYRSRKDPGAGNLWPIGLSSILVGVLSAIYHASRAFETEFLDIFSMDTFVVYAFVVTLYRRWGIAPARLVGLYFGLIAASLVAMWLVKPIGVAIFAGFIFAVLGLEHRINRLQPSAADGDRIDYWQLKRLLIWFAAALAVWIPDTTRLLCWPDNHILQGHAAWHVINSFCFYYLYLFYRQFDFGGGTRKPLFKRLAAAA